MPTGARIATVVRKPKVDKLSPTPAGATIETTLIGLIVLPRQTYEQGKGWITIDGRDVYILPTSRAIPAGTTIPRKVEDGDVLASDQMRIDGDTWQVDGQPAAYDKGTTRKATLIRLKRVGT
jgi:hypothetical protein